MHLKVLPAIKKIKLFFIVQLYTVFCFAQQPIINSFAPASGPAGSAVTISGSNFSAVAANNIVFFGAVKASVTAASTTSLTVSVPFGATYQPITVTTGGLTGYSSKPFIQTFTGGITIGIGSFEPRFDTTTDIRPTSIAAADFDGDGKADIATANNYSTANAASVSILRNTSSTGAISFAPKQDLATAAYAYAIAVADINGDGKPDLVYSNIVANTISVLKNTSTVGNISFAAAINLPAVSGVHSITINDLDADGKPDIAFVSYISGIVSVYRNTGTGGNISFAARLDFASSPGPRCIATGDLDGDGKPDLAVSNEFSNSVSAFRNTSTPGSVSFAAKVDFTTGASPFSVAIGDLNNDGKPDLAVGNNGSVNFSTFKNTSTVGAISFAPKVDFSGGSTQYLVSIGDVNGDGKPDIVMPSLNTTVSENTSTASTISFGAPVSLSLIASPFSIAIADLDGDGKDDIAAPAFTQTWVSLLRNRNNEPIIDFFNPSTAATGATVLITGTNFTGTSAVSFGGVPAASFTVLSNSAVNAVVGTGASGAVKLTNQYGSGKRDNFTFAGPPVLNSISPSSAGYGQTVTITGANFSGNVFQVRFGNVDALSFTVVSPTTITAVVGTGATGDVKVTSNYGAGSIAGFTYLPIPVVNSFAPLSAGAGGIVTISGNNFTGTTAVSFGGVAAATFTVVNATTITAVVGAGASGAVKVTNTFGNHSRPGFTFYPAPTITSFSPTVGWSGTVVTVNGTNFNNIVGVAVGGQSYLSSYTYISPTQIQITIQSQGASGSIEIATWGGLGSMSGFVFEPQPFVTGISPAEAGPGMAVNITGTHFNGATAVTLGGVAVSSFVINSPTSITAIVGAGASGNIIVTNSYGVNTSSPYFTFTIRPIIYSFAPTSGPVGSVVTFNGGNFNTVPANNIVYFGAVRATVLSSTVNTLSVVVPVGTTYQPITVTTNYHTGETNKPFNITFPGGGVPFTANSFAGKIDFVAPVSPRKIRMADLDNDGKPDVIVASGTKLTFFKNLTSGNAISFAPGIDFNVNYFINAFEAGDIDGDGKLDITVVTENLNNNFILKNTSTSGNITFTVAATFTSDVGPTQIAIGDLNKDGKPEVVVGNLNQSVVSVYKNLSSSGTISLQYKQTIPIYRFIYDGVYSSSIAIRDFNNDGLPDIVVGSDMIYFTILKNNQNLNFTAFFIGNQSSNALNFMVVADFNQDDKPDIISNGYLLTGQGNFGFNYASFPGGICGAADLDGDGKPDFASIKFASQQLINAYRNATASSTITFDPVVSYAAGNIADDIAVGDLDGDGRPDIAFCSKLGNTFSILKNQVGVTQACAGGNISLTSNVTGTTYQWQENTGSGFVNISNNANYSGTNTVTLQLTNIPASWNGYSYRCVVDVTNYSNIYSLAVNGNTATVSIATPVTTICTGTPVTFTATVANAGTTPIYQWKINGINTGTNSPVLLTSSLANGNQVTCILTSNSACVSSTPVTSNIITMVVNSSVPPTATITTPNTINCVGTAVTFTATATNQGTNPSYQWQVNGVNAGTNSNTFTTSTLINNALVKVILTSSLGCALPATATSNIITMTVIPLPIANAGNDVNICIGGSTQLLATGGTTYLWSPVLGLSNPNVANPIASPAATTTYTVTVSNGINCTSNDAVVVSVGPPATPAVSISTPNNNICSGNAATFTAAATNGGSNPNYQWQVNGINAGTNNNTFTSSSLTNNNQVTVILTSNSNCVTTPTATSNIITMTVDQLVTPLVSLSNREFTVTNPDAAAIYTWQIKINTAWGNVVPAATGITYTAPAGGEYRVKAVKGGCIVYSTSQVANRNLNTLNHPFGIYLYPNPNNGILNIDSIRISQKWQTLDIIDAQGKFVLTFDIKNRSSVSLDISMLKAGTYFAQLKKIDGVYYTVEFIKL